MKEKDVNLGKSSNWWRQTRPQPCLHPLSLFRKRERDTSTWNTVWNRMPVFQSVEVLSVSFSLFLRRTSDVSCSSSSTARDTLPFRHMLVTIRDNSLTIGTSMWEGKWEAEHVIENRCSASMPGLSYYRPGIHEELSFILHGPLLTAFSFSIMKRALWKWEMRTWLLYLMLPVEPALRWRARGRGCVSNPSMISARC